MTFRKTLWYFLYYWQPSWIFCVIVDKVLEHKIPQNKNVILNTKVKFVCPLCIQTWYMIMIIETLSAILAAILFRNFERKKLKIEFGMGQIWNQHIRIVWKQVLTIIYMQSMVGQTQAENNWDYKMRLQGWYQVRPRLIDCCIYCQHRENIQSLR